MSAISEILDRPLTIARCLLGTLEQCEAPILSAVGQEPMTGAGVLSAIRVQGTILRAMGFTRSDRIAYALPDSGGTALLAMTIMSVGTAAPINPRLAQNEIENTLRNLRVQSLIVPAGQDTAARRAARALGLHTINFDLVQGSYAGHYELLGPSLRRADAMAAPVACENDHALVVQTSGTTGAQKIVALTHRNLLSMMLANRDRLGMTSTDRCLGVMPLFHIHGLGAAIVSFLSGAMIHILPEFSVAGFYQALRDVAPTWYTAVPTIHQNILRGAGSHRDIVDHVASTRQLRFIRSGSAPMPVGIPEELERVFNTRYVEACGATECSAYICSNSPNDRKIGSVGRPMPGNEVLILGNSGKFLGPGEEGEILARGPGVFAGYEGRPELTAESFHNGFFRTGDLGYFDDEGYFYLTGRLKEQINRAGMKISPREVDDAMARHPAVHLGTAFAVPDALLGDEVHAAIVLKPGQTVSALEMQRFLAKSLADYKVPRVIHFVSSIPTNSTGKIVRIGLAQKLGIVEVPRIAPQLGEPQAPFTPTQLSIAAIFARILCQPVNDIDFNFQAAGGDSMQAMNLSLELEKQFARQIPISAISGNATVRRLAELIEDDGWTPEPAAPVVFRAPNPDRPTLFCLPGVGGNVWCYAAVASSLSGGQGVIGLPLPGTDGSETPLAQMDRLVDRFVDSIRSKQHTGPYILAGYSFGGRVAFEVCRRLRSQGESIANLILIDTAGPNWPRPLPMHRRLAIHARRLLSDGPIRWIGSVFNRRSWHHGMTPDEVLEGLTLTHASPERQKAQLELIEAAGDAARAWKPTPLDIPITVLRASQCVWKDCDTSDDAMGWRPFTSGAIDVQYVAGSHGTLFHPPHVRGLAMAISLAVEVGARKMPPSR